MRFLKAETTIIAFLFFSLFGFQVIAQTPDGDSFTGIPRTEYIYSTGRSSGMCSGSMGYYCLDQLKQSAQRDAVQNATWTCQSRKGKVTSFSPSCSDFCNPLSIPQDQNVFASCQSDCNIQCQIPQPIEETTE